MAQPNFMEDFVDWDQATHAIGGSQQVQDLTNPMAAHPADVDDQLDLVLANVNEDDFSFHALQHFSEMAAMDNIDLAIQEEMPTASMQDFPALQWETPSVPCAQCTLGGYSCKRIREGSYQGFCTSCVALMVDCSFGGIVPQSLNPASTTLPTQTWPSLKDYPTDLNEQHVEQPLQPLSSASAMKLFQVANVSGLEAESQSRPPPKVGARLSRESVRVLKNWLTTHNRHPYPSDEEKEMLQRQTGLSKVQITNWLANARRRGKVQPPRSTSPQVGNLVGSVNIHRRDTPSLEAMNPLQRWQNSPPEHEPASVTDIARAVTTSRSTSSGITSPFSFPYTDDGSGRSLCNQSSASSFGTSQSSNGSKGSAYSHGSRNSFGSFGSNAPFRDRTRRRRRRRTVPRQSPDSKITLSQQPLKTFQCTFCTETFRTKHDWQRHEKSLHLSSERWVCAPEGPRVLRPETGQLCCAFCGEADPDDEHVENHNHSNCQERTLEERTFYRKDHLNQHLRLVHNVKFADWSMKGWKVATPEIRSRCGFCGTVMDTWSNRVEHLAEHFKSGSSMADWQGDWGFDAPVLAMVENSVPPYLIHHERLSPLPYIAGKSSPESPRNAYELIKLEMVYFVANYALSDAEGRPPSDEEMMVEACRIIFASETLSLQGIATQMSWLRDIIMSNEELAQKARFGPLRSATENRLASLKINGKDNLFEQCPMEQQLREFVSAKELLGLTAMDFELQEEACKIVGRVEEVSTNPSECVANWLVRLVNKSTGWLAGFRRRALLPRSEDVSCDQIRSTDPTAIDSTVYNYSRLERELSDFLKLQRSWGREPSDDDLQRQARIIIYEFDDGWNQTAADNVNWLRGFRNRHPPAEPSPAESGLSAFSHLRTTQSSAGAPSNTASTPGFSQDRPPALPTMPGPQIEVAQMGVTRDNCYRQLHRELGRYVRSAMSPHNPNQHVPNDAELQHQARWIIHNDDDPWNWTAADNTFWLERFKRDYGLVASSEDFTSMDGWSNQLGQHISTANIEPQAPVARPMVIALPAGNPLLATMANQQSSGVLQMKDSLLDEVDFDQPGGARLGNGT